MSATLYHTESKISLINKRQKMLCEGLWHRLLYSNLSYGLLDFEWIMYYYLYNSKE